jgi:hypothetical protein
MFFAGNTPKRGFSTRKCKESARMASLNTSPTAVRAFVPEACPTLASCAPRKTERDAWARGTDLGAAVLGLAMLGLGVVGALPTAVQAKALASASMNVQNVTWYQADGSVLVSIIGQSVVGTPELRTLNDRLEAGFPPGNRENRELSAIEDSLTFGRCTGNGCASSAPTSDFDAITSAIPDSDYVNALAKVDGFYTDVANRTLDPPSGATGGARADVSLSGTSQSGETRARWNSTSAYDAYLSNDFDDESVTLSTYFEVTFAAQALASTTVAGDLAESDLTMALTLSDGSTGLPVQPRWDIVALATNPLDPRCGSLAGSSGVDCRATATVRSPANYVLVNGRTYSLLFDVLTNAEAITIAAVPIASSAVLVFLGLIPLVLAGRSRRFD